MFSRMETQEEDLLEDGECLAGLTPDPAHPPRSDKRSIIHTYRYPEQESKLKTGDSAAIGPGAKFFDGIKGTQQCCEQSECRTGRECHVQLHQFRSTIGCSCSGRPIISGL